MYNRSIPPKVKLPIVENYPTHIVLIRIIILICGIAIINIWPLANSIAARNIVLALGATLSIILIFQSFKRLPVTSLLSSYFLLGLVCWVLLLYFINPISPETQWQEIKSTWLRVTLATLLGTGLGLACSGSSTFKTLTLLGFLPLLATQSVLYLHQLYTLSDLSPPFTIGIFVTKAGGTYFLMWPFLLICAYIDFLFNPANNATQQRNTVLKLGFCLPIFTICFLAFYSLGSLNGLLIACICTFVLIGRIVIKVFLHRRHIIMGTGIFASFLIISAASIHMYSKQDGNKYHHLLRDIQIGAQIDRYTNWRNDTPIWVPDLPGQFPVSHSTYYRVANFINGTHLITGYPLGAGFTYHPYGFYMSRIYPGSTVTHTHSGWVDFTLGVGVPGLLLCWLAIASGILLAIKNQMLERYAPSTNLWSFIVIWGLSGISLLWVVAEVSEKEYIEHLMFMIALLASGNSPHPAVKKILNATHIF
jgi:hypothetical protein